MTMIAWGKTEAREARRKGIHHPETSPVTHWRPAAAGYLVPGGGRRMGYIVEWVQELYYVESKRFAGKWRLRSSTGGRRGSTQVWQLGDG